MVAMSNLVINDVKFLPGTQVSVYPGGAQHEGTDPGGAPGFGSDPVETQTVASDQTLTFTTLVDGQSYCAFAKVGSEYRYIAFRKGSTFSAPPTWKARVAARRAAIGTS